MVVVVRTMKIIGIDQEGFAITIFMHHTSAILYVTGLCELSEEAKVSIIFVDIDTQDKEE